MMARNKRLVIILSVATALLLAPLVAMQFTRDVNWTVSDFVAGGVLLYGSGLACELVLRKVRRKAARIAICIALLVALFLTWAELAVGIFGTPFAGS